MKGNTLFILAIIVSLVVGVGAGYAVARSKYKSILAEKDAYIQSQQNMAKASQAKEMHMVQKPTVAIKPDGVGMQLDKMMVFKNGQATIMDKDMVMTDGTKVMTDGKVMMKDGSSMTLKSGEEITMDGKMVTPSPSPTQK